MTDLVVWPRGLLVPRQSAINPAPSTIAGPASLSGFRQAVASPAAVWLIRYEGVPVGTVAQRLVLRALAAQIEGRATPILLPVYDLDDLRPIAVGAGGTAPHSDTAAHSDGTPCRTARAQVLAASAVARGANRLTVTTLVGAGLQAGQHFSVGSRLYRVKSITAVAGADTTLTFWPVARDAILAGAEIETDEPVCKVRLLSDNGLDLALDMGVIGRASIGFIEDPS